MDSDRVKGAARTIGGKIEGGVGEMAGNTKLEAEGLVDQAKGTVQNAYGQAKDAARDYVDRAGDYVDQAREAAGRAVDQGKRYVDEEFDRYQDVAERRVREGREAVSRQIEQSPLAAMLIAGAVGYALALLVHGRR